MEEFLQMVYKEILNSAVKGKKLFSVLVDPDKYGDNELLDILNIAKQARVDYFFVGGSLMTSLRFDRTIDIIKETSSIPVVIFPGSNVQVSAKADALLFLSLISGRNPEYLIGQQVVAAPYVKSSGIEVISTGYMLIESEKVTTANYMSNSIPIPREKADIASCTALAGQMLGMNLIYMDGGSGAGNTISGEMIRRVKDEVDIPLIIGGGITTADQAIAVWEAGADMIVVGNAIEDDVSVITSISQALNKVG